MAEFTRFMSMTLPNPPKRTFGCVDVNHETNLSEGGSWFEKEVNYMERLRIVAGLTGVPQQGLEPITQHVIDTIEGEVVLRRELERIHQTDVGKYLPNGSPKQPLRHSPRRNPCM